MGLALPRPAVASTLVDYTLRRSRSARSDRARRRRAAARALSLGFNLTLLGFFKYFNFFADNLHALFGALGWQLDFVTLRVLLPVGISFYTFVTMSYVIDVYRREIPATRDLLDFAVFVAYFPHLVAGPILRASRLLPQIHDAAHGSPREQMRDGAVADRLGLLPEDVRRRQPGGARQRGLRAGRRTHTGVNVLLGIYAFAFQIYGDFAGYSNIARGTSKLMGIELHRELPVPVFRAHAAGRSGATGTSACRPGCATTSTFRSAAAAGRRGRRERNLLITMVLGGLWHGAAWTFMLWGSTTACC